MSPSGYTIFTKTSPKHSFSLNRKRAFWLVFAKTGSIISVTALLSRCSHTLAKLAAILHLKTETSHSGMFVVHIYCTFPGTF
jgi:hypothetical protein